MARKVKKKGGELFKEATPSGFEGSSLSCFERPLRHALSVAKDLLTSHCNLGDS
jgi:hypothetical protein